MRRFCHEGGQAVQWHGFGALQNLSWRGMTRQHHPDTQKVCEAGAISAVTHAMRQFDSIKRIQQLGIDLLCSILDSIEHYWPSFHTNTLEAINFVWVTEDWLASITAVLAAMKKYPMHENIQQVGASFLCMLLVRASGTPRSNAFKGHIIKEGGIKVLVDAERFSGSNGVVRRATCEGLLRCRFSDSSCAYLGEVDFCYYGSNESVSLWSLLCGGVMKAKTDSSHMTQAASSNTE
jgi:hypothetical protein